MFQSLAPGKGKIGASNCHKVNTHTRAHTHKHTHAHTHVTASTVAGLGRCGQTKAFTVPPSRWMSSISNFTDFTGASLFPGGKQAAALPTPGRRHAHANQGMFGRSWIIIVGSRQQQLMVGPPEVALVQVWSQREDRRSPGSVSTLLASFPTSVLQIP